MRIMLLALFLTGCTSITNNIPVPAGTGTVTINVNANKNISTLPVNAEGNTIPVMP